MAEMKSYPVEFIQRTHELLDKSFHDFAKEDREVTFLMNCLLGLIVTLSENEKWQIASLQR
ncbi:MAG: hypothetical protein JSW47_12915 [Phycisphaerales bacterium]|nr:MAG: hypothetical protein JSW47_12915 [Phycisphaerales bacterium]